MELSGLLNVFVFTGIFASIYALLSLGLNLQWGYTGLFNVGVAGFYAIGAYTSALLTTPPSPYHLGGLHLPIPVGMLGAMLTSGLLAYVVGKPTLRLREDYLAIATISIAETLRLLLKNEAWLTNGVQGLGDIPRPFPQAFGAFYDVFYPGPPARSPDQWQAQRLQGVWAIDYFSGRLFFQGIEGRFNSESYQAFLQMILAQTTQHLFLIHDGARYHTSAATQAFLAAHRDRITAEPLPSYSPDYNPIEFLWKKTKQRATHNKYFKEFIALTVSVDKALAYFATHPDTVLGLFGRYCEESGLELKRAA